jgi:adenine specific DNA methylase Mod
VKCVYIDPPYNTGNEGWVYNDNLTQPQFKEWIGRTVGKEGEDACRHDKWCCMMYPRLVLLRELLRDDGSIWISIDDNEIHNLRHLMDEIFGAVCYVATVIWQKRYAVSSDAKGIPELHDYIVVYGKRPDFQPKLLARTAKQDHHYKNPDNDPRGPWRADNLLRREYRERDVFPIKSPKTGKLFVPPPGSSWRHPQVQIEAMIADNRIWFGKDGNARPVPKRFLSEVRQGVVASGWWPHEDVGHTDEASKELANLFGGDPQFSFPKPVRLIERILTLATDTGDLVLDSFAGSGTTGHAVITKNVQDSGARSFILAQQPHDSLAYEEKKLNIARQITAKRIRHAIRAERERERERERQMPCPMRHSRTPMSETRCSANIATLARGYRTGKRWPATSSTPRLPASATPRNSTRSLASSARPTPPAALRIT